MKIKIYRDFQQRTDKWMEIKRGKTSGSGIKPILSAKSKGPLETYAWKLIAQLEDKEPAKYVGGYLSAAVQWGVDMEPEAITKFEEKTGKIVEDVAWVDSLDPKLVHKSGCSPDGIIDIYEWIEVKCLATENHMKYVAANVLPLEYKPQVLNYFVINPDLKKVYFILYDPRLKTKSKRLHIIEVTREEYSKEIDGLYDKLVVFNDMKSAMYKGFLGIQ